MMPRWEPILPMTQRLPIPGGHLYRVVDDNMGFTVVFVPAQTDKCPGCGLNLGDGAALPDDRLLGP